MRGKRDTVWREAGAASGHAVALVAALALAASPVLAQQQNGCQAALAQVQQARNQIILQHTNAEQTMTTDRRNAILDCEKQAVGGGAAANNAMTQCEKNVSDTYARAEIDLQQAFNNALNQEQIVENDVAAGPSCSWTPEEITQFVGTVGQAAAQLGQAAAQIISAAKGKGAGATNAGAAGGAGAKPPASTGTTPPAGTPAPKPPASPKPPTPPKAPANGSSGTTPPATGTGSPTQ